MRLIDADALLAAVMKNNVCQIGDCTITFDYGAVAAINNAPTIAAEPVRHGAWVKSDIPHEKYCCSVCGCACWYYDFEGDVARSRFCPSCGAKMDGEPDV